MKSIYRRSKYGFLEMEDACESDRMQIELASLCVNGVYGSALITKDRKLHVIFNPEKTDLNEISCVVAFAGYDTNLHEANKTVYSLLPHYYLKSCVYYVNRSAFIDLLISGLNVRQ